MHQDAEEDAFEEEEDGSDGHDGHGGDIPHHVSHERAHSIVYAHVDRGNAEVQSDDSDNAKDDRDSCDIGAQCQLWQCERSDGEECNVDGE